MKYLFILGRNVKLSLAEVFSYFESCENKIKSYDVLKNGLLIDLENEIGNIIEEFGGIISIGEVLAQGEVLESLEKIDLYKGTSNKFNYCIWDFSRGEFVEEVRDYLKDRFRKEKLKTTEKRFSNFITLQDGKKALNISSSMIDSEYFVFEGKEKIFGKIIQKCDYENIEKRDMQKPVRRHELSISPRLAKIMINLSGTKKGEFIVDPFCGIGVVLQEALLLKRKVVGIDKDPLAVKGAKENLEWFSFSKEDYEVNNFDSTKFKIRKVEAIVTEPDLGKILKKVPTLSEAKKTLLKFENLIIRVINNLKSKNSGKIVFTSPYIRTVNSRVGCNISRILEQVEKYKLKEGFPILEFRHNQIVGRQIFVLE